MYMNKFCTDKPRRQEAVWASDNQTPGLHGKGYSEQFKGR